MERRSLGKTGLEVSVLGFGGSEIGYQGASPEQVERLLSSALDAGLNAVDTAECYKNSEELIGRAVSGRRNDYYLFTKCGHESGLGLPEWTPQLVQASIERSLKLLRTDYLDVVHLHSCSRAVLEKGDVIEALQRARDAGKTRFIGYSGDGGDAEYAVKLGVFDTLMTSVSIADQEGIERVLPEAARRGIGVIVKRPIANAAWMSATQPQTRAYERVYWDRLQELRYDFLAGTPENAVGTALRFALAQPAVATAIVGTKNPDRWRENAKLLEAGPLTQDRLQAIRERWLEIARPDWVGQR